MGEETLTGAFHPERANLLPLGMLLGVLLVGLLMAVVGAAAVLDARAHSFSPSDPASTTVFDGKDTSSINLS